MTHEFRRPIAEEQEKSQESKEVNKERATGFSEVYESSSQEEMLLAVDTILTNPEAFIDAGGAGAVYRLSEKKVCIKVFHPHKDTERRKTGVNVVAREASLTEMASRYAYAGVRSPRCLGFFVIDNVDGRSALILEELNAVNLNHVIEGKVPAPAAFNPEQFMDALYDYIENLHEKAQMVHGDLYARNIMIDRETGAPYVIDFGEAKNLSKMERIDRERKKHAEIALLNEINERLGNA